MTARSRSAISTLVLALLAGGAIWLARQGDRRSEAAETAREREARVFSFDAKDVQEITVRAKGDVTRLAREGDGWRLAAPVEGEADAYAANDVAEALATLRRTREAAPPGGDPARFGLAPPAATVEVVLEGGRRETLAVGEQSAFDGSLFVRPTSGAVLVVPAAARWRLERSTEELKAKPKPAAEPASAAPGAPNRVDRGPTSP